ncbi:hypohtetical protein [Serratia phage vB_SmaM_Hera]|uniref:Uncharacterized protein n=2 Tax=Myosmarvirus MTx TaxID=2846180 RepID=A0A482MIG5_9CAUD|nr:hypothetical protein HWC15_gp051 [Serratia phage MTx]QBQ72357.1 hypothetical protein CPT_MTx_051 [Serratia phage MTx]QPX74715.1 hypohtetical protein [Serratia phage vB_SmaM_Hera]WLW40849.1 hypothetical protein GNAINCEL_00067 [Serratia phage KKP 3709]
MSRKTKEFEAFGEKYRVKQYSAVDGIDIFDNSAIKTPMEILAHTEILVGKSWRPLNDAYNIDKYIKDKIAGIAPRLVLNGIQSVVCSFNFDFMESWRAVKVPRRFMSSSEIIKSENVNGLIAQLVTAEVATMRELEEYYSLQDAFGLLDILMAKGVNQAQAHEDAVAEAKHK